MGYSFPKTPDRMIWPGFHRFAVSSVNMYRIASRSLPGDDIRTPIANHIASGEIKAQIPGGGLEHARLGLAA